MNLSRIESNFDATLPLALYDSCDLVRHLVLIYTFKTHLRLPVFWAAR
jgi:hypothetical protein